MKRTEIKYFKSGSGRIVITDIKYCASMNLIEVEFGKSVRNAYDMIVPRYYVTSVGLNEVFHVIYEDGYRDSFDLPMAFEKDQFERLVKTMKQAGENLTRLRSEDPKTVLI
jgi:hypothetical protein